MEWNRHKNAIWTTKKNAKSTSKWRFKPWHNTIQIGVSAVAVWWRSLQSHNFNWWILKKPFSSDHLHVATSNGWIPRISLYFSNNLAFIRNSTFYIWNETKQQSWNLFSRKRYNSLQIWIKWANMDIEMSDAFIW